MAKEAPESICDTVKYGKFICPFQPDIIALIEVLVVEKNKPREICRRMCFCAMTPFRVKKCLQMTNYLYLYLGYYEWNSIQDEDRAHLKWLI